MNILLPVLNISMLRMPLFSMLRSISGLTALWISSYSAILIGSSIRSSARQYLFVQEFLCGIL